MPSFDTARRVASVKNNSAKTIGQIHKEQSDYLMEMTWDNDIQSKVCYVYDYFHDDQKHLKSHMTYKNTTKTRIDAKFIVKTYQSIDKDQIEYYVQFKPSQKTEFDYRDELYYFETDYREKYGNDDFIGLYIDIPDDKGIYRKWMIARKEIANQFVKYLVLPCNYELMWVERNGHEKFKRRMWCVLRSQNSYNSGLWTDNVFTSQENQKKCWLPLNSISEKIWYTNDLSKNTRMLVSAFAENPLAWVVSKVENANTIGIQMITLYQDYFNQHKDFIERSDDGKIIGLWADYYDDVKDELTQNEVANEFEDIMQCQIISSTPFIKIGGSYKTLSVKIFDQYSSDVTNDYKEYNFDWKCFVENTDVTNHQFITWKDYGDFNQKKIKLNNEKSYLGKIMTVKCVISSKDNSLFTDAQFDLVI